MMFWLVLAGSISGGTLLTVYGSRARYTLRVEHRKTIGLSRMSFGIVLLSFALFALLIYGAGSALAIP
jgi:hypothetical protein